MLEKKMNIFFYKKEDTFIHNLDPRAKMLALIFIFTAAAAAGNLLIPLLITVSLLAMFFSARAMDSLRRMAAMFLIIAAMTFALWVVFYEGGEKLFELGPIAIYKGAIMFAFMASVRFINLLLAGLLYLSVASLEDMSDSLILFGIPYSVAFTISLSFRLVIVFVSTGFAIVEAQKVRGNNPENGGFIKRIGSYVPLLIPLIINGIKKAETLTLALESKGFSPKNKIDMTGKHRFKATDLMVVLLTMAVAAAAIAAGFAA
jgi:energy-coupling factor transport system permease protein